jgi:hypothetical protein
MLVFIKKIVHIYRTIYIFKFESVKFSKIDPSIFRKFERLEIHKLWRGPFFWCGHRP